MVIYILVCSDGFCGPESTGNQYPACWAGSLVPRLPEINSKMALVEESSQAERLSSRSGNRPVAAQIARDRSLKSTSEKYTPRGH